MPGLTRRTFALTLAAAPLVGCATTAATVSASALGHTDPLAPHGPYRLARVHIAEDRIIRTVVGLRPFRPGGFVVRAERFGDKTLVHNYGHGGGGITLSWGTSHLAVDAGFAGPDRDYAVLGSGAVGLATARLIQQRGGRAHIYAKALPPDTTSNIAGGQWWPASVYNQDAIEPGFRDTFVQAARLAYRHYQPLVGPRYGVHWTRNYYLDQRSLEDAVGLLSDFAPEARMLEPGEHPFGQTPVVQIDGMQIEPATYLQAMLDDVYAAGGRISVREFSAPQEVQALAEPVVFNCTGLGAKALFGDDQLEPLRGQLVVLLPQPEVTYNLLGGGAYMFPRSDGIILGGTFDHGVWETEPQPELTARILARNRAMFARMVG